MRTIRTGPREVLLRTAIVFAGLAPQILRAQQSAVDLVHGAALYSMHCGRCHGENGDDYTCSGDMTPLAGMCKRPRVGMVANHMSPSYFSRGRRFEGDDARDLTAYLCSLKGEKGFDAPEFICLPRLLSKKCTVLKHYRVIDVRDKASYAKGHVPNAALWPVPLADQPPLGSAPDQVRATLGSFGVRPETMIVIYDEGVSTKAALLWWSLMRAGHRNVAILDGGLRRWVQEDNPLSSGLTPFEPVEYEAVESTAAQALPVNGEYPVLQLSPGSRTASPGKFDPELAVVDGGLRTALEIRACFSQCEISPRGTYRIEGSISDAPFVVYLLSLLGCSDVRFDPSSKLLRINGGTGIL
jgi:rhodanese-related sulfurtransferase